MRHNARHKLRGHLFQGRYQAVLVEGADDTHFQTASDYIHLNPIRARLIEAKQMLADYGPLGCSRSGCWAGAAGRIIRAVGAPMGRAWRSGRPKSCTAGRWREECSKL